MHITQPAQWLFTLTADHLTEAMTNERGRPFREDDIPGASLGGRSANTLTIPALKRWLQCRGAPTKGKKADLVER